MFVGQAVSGSGVSRISVVVLMERAALVRAEKLSAGV
jgi:hypothetical protein